MLFILKNISQEDYDCVRAFVIRAKSVIEAREIAAKNAVDEGADIWTNINLSTCAPIESEGNSEVICSDILEG